MSKQVSGRSTGLIPIATSEFVARRERVLEALGSSVAVVLAGDGAAPLLGAWQPDMHFAYLTGITNEPGAAVLFDPKAKDPTRRCVLFLKPLNPEMEAWDGFRETIGPELEAKHGFAKVMRTSALARLLTEAARKRKKLACLHTFSTYDAPVSSDLAVYRKVSERVLGVGIEDRTELLPQMRAIKSPAELALMRAAIQATHAGFDSAARALKPNVNERDVQRALENGWNAAGATGLAYNPIVGAGRNSCVLHYHDNDKPVGANHLLLIDAGCSVHGYCADITRTYPAGGRFTPRHREIYELVLEAQEAAIAAVKPGAWMHEVDGAARGIFRKAKVLGHCLHGIGHQLGLEVHDATPSGPLAPGMVVTIEPGLYLASEAIGVRIEDDVLVTKSGCENLSRAIPKRVKDVEEMVG